MKLSHRKLTIAMTFLTALVLCASLAFVGPRGLAQKSTTNPDGSTTKTEPDGKGGTNETTTTKDGVTRVVNKDKDGLPLKASETSKKKDHEIEITWGYDKLKRLTHVLKIVNGDKYIVRWEYKELTDKDKKEGKGPDLEGTARGEFYDTNIQEWVPNKASIGIVESNLKRFDLVLFPKILHQYSKIDKAAGQSAESTSAQGTATAQLVGLVYDKDNRQAATMSLTTDLKKYENIPGLGVIEMKIPASAGATAQDVLQGLVVDLGDGPKPSNQPFTTQIAQGATSIPVKVSWQGNATPVAQSSVPITQGQSNTTIMDTGKAGDFTTPPVVQNTSFIRGPLSGDANKQRITVDNQAVAIIAGSDTTVFFDLPPEISAGPHQVTFQDGSRSASFRIVRMGINGHIDEPELQRGQKTNYSVTVNFGELAASVWRRGGGMCPELVNPSQIQQAAPGFRIPKPSEPAVVFLSVTNGSPGVVKIREVMRALHQQDFQNNQFTTGGEVQSERSGGFVLNLRAEAFFAPIHGEEVLGGMLLTTTLEGEEFDDKGKKIKNVNLPVDPTWKCEQGKCPELKTTKSGHIYCQFIKDSCGGEKCQSICQMLKGHKVQRDGKDVEEWGLTGQNSNHGMVPEEEKLPTDKAKKEKEIEGHAIPPEKGKYSCGCTPGTR